MSQINIPPEITDPNERLKYKIDKTVVKDDKTLADAKNLLESLGTMVAIDNKATRPVFQSSLDLIRKITDFESQSEIDRENRRQNMLLVQQGIYNKDFLKEK